MKLNPIVTFLLNLIRLQGNVMVNNRSYLTGIINLEVFNQKKKKKKKLNQSRVSSD